MFNLRVDIDTHFYLLQFWLPRHLLPVTNLCIRLVLRLNLPLGHRAALGNHLALRVDIEAPVNLLGRAQRRQRLGVHVAKHAVRADKVGPVRGGGRAERLGRVLRDVGHDEAVFHPLLARPGSALAGFVCSYPQLATIAKIIWI